MPVAPLYPLTFEPIYKPKVWGGRTLERFGRRLPGGPDQAIGESWDLADLDSTSPSGGGGDPAHSVIANGPYTGTSIDRLIADLGPAIHGTLALDAAGRFPMLIKTIDARQNLSVQVHPSQAYAAAHPEAHLKSEAWYVLAADPGAVIYIGVREGVTATDMRQAVERGNVAELLEAVGVQPGDCYYLPSGTVHALGGGIVVAEVQTPSDTTFRVYDWGRTGRELHVEQALECIRFGPAETDRYQPRTMIGGPHGARQCLVHCEHFRIERHTATAGSSHPLERIDQPRVLIHLRGEVEITCTHAAMPSLAPAPLQTVLLPAAIDEPTLRAASDAVWLDVTFPRAGEHLLA